MMKPLAFFMRTLVWVKVMWWESYQQVREWLIHSDSIGCRIGLVIFRLSKIRNCGTLAEVNAETSACEQLYYKEHTIMNWDREYLRSRETTWREQGKTAR
jgi:hypothetical protein